MRQRRQQPQEMRKVPDKLPDNLLDAFRKGLKEARKQRKSDDILAFIRHNWHLFCKSRDLLDQLCEELEQRGDLSVTSLAQALGLPDCMYFKKAPVVDTAKLVLRLESSSVYRAFVNLVEKERERRGCSHDPFVCLFVVAGAHSLVITNMRTRIVPGLAVHCMPAAEGRDDVHIFPAADAMERLPSLFRKED